MQCTMHNAMIFPFLFLFLLEYSRRRLLSATHTRNWLCAVDAFVLLSTWSVAVAVVVSLYSKEQGDATLQGGYYCLCAKATGNESDSTFIIQGIIRMIITHVRTVPCCTVPTGTDVNVSRTVNYFILKTDVRPCDRYLIWKGERLK